MGDNKELKGSYVLIHPDVYYDEENHQGYTGILTEADEVNDRFYVDFGNGQEPRRFATDWLMVLRGRDEIYKDLFDNAKNLAKRDIRDLYSICLLMDSPEAAHYQRALELASSNSKIREYTLVTLEDQLALGVRLTAGGDHQMSRGRGR